LKNFLLDCNVEVVPGILSDKDTDRSMRRGPTNRAGLAQRDASEPRRRPTNTTTAAAAATPDKGE
jgi:hypothetical protein